MRDSLRVLVVSYLPPTPGGIATSAGLLRDEWRNDEIRLQFLGLPALASRTPVLGLLGTLKFVLEFTHRMAFERPDILHLKCALSPRGVWRDLLAAAIARASGRTVLVHYHGSLSDVMPRLPRPSRAALRQLMRLASFNIGITLLSERVLRCLSPSTEAVYLPNIVEEELMLRPRPGGEFFRADRCRAIYVGRLSRDKGTPELLRAAGALPNVDFELVGQVLDDVSDLLDIAPPNIVVSGPLPRSRVIERLLASDIFVFPSRREGFPNALLEAMAAGLPAVATKVGAVSEMIEEGRGGLLVEPGDAIALTRSIERLARNRADCLRMGAHNRAICAARFAAPVVEDILAGIYRRAASSVAGRKRGAHEPAGTAEDGAHS